MRYVWRNMSAPAVKIIARFSDPRTQRVLGETLRFHKSAPALFKPVFSATDEAAALALKEAGPEKDALLFLTDIATLPPELAAALKDSGAVPLLLTEPDLMAADPLFPPSNIFYFPLRLGALLDRLAHAGQSEHKRADAKREIKIGSYIFVPQDSALVDAGTVQTIRLTEKERDILSHLYEAAPRAVARQERLDRVWGYAPGIETHTLETHIYRLRQKIEKDPVQPLYIRTEDEGYRLFPAGTGD